MRGFELAKLYIIYLRVFQILKNHYTFKILQGNLKVELKISCFLVIISLWYQNSVCFCKMSKKFQILLSHKFAKEGKSFFSKLSNIWVKVCKYLLSHIFKFPRLCSEIYGEANKEFEKSPYTKSIMKGQTCLVLSILSFYLHDWIIWPLNPIKRD